MSLQHLPCLVHEDLRLVRRRLALRPLDLLRAQEDGALGEKRADGGSEERDAGRRPEEGAPARGNVRDEAEVDASGEQITDSVTLLQDTRPKPTRLDGKVLEGGGCCQTPNATHADTEEGPDAEEGLVGVDEAGAQLEHGDDDEVDDERPLATETVRDDTKQDGADASQEQRQGYRLRLENRWRSGNLWAEGRGKVRTMSSVSRSKSSDSGLTESDTEKKSREHGESDGHRARGGGD